MSPSKLLFPLIALALGGVLGYFARGGGSHVSHPRVSIRQAENNLIQPLLECEGAESLFADLRPSKQAVEAIIEKAVRAGKIKEASVYYRNLGDGPWFYINPEIRFSPASLMKVPVMVSYLKHSEVDPGILSRRTKFAAATLLSVPRIPPRKILENGKEYSVEELIRHMVAYSDNQAAYFLLTRMDPDALNAIYQDLGIPIPKEQNEENWISTREYASIFVPATARRVELRLRAPKGTPEDQPVPIEITSTGVTLAPAHVGDAWKTVSVDLQPPPPPLAFNRINLRAVHVSRVNGRPVGVMVADYRVVRIAWELTPAAPDGSHRP